MQGLQLAVLKWAMKGAIVTAFIAILNQTVNAQNVLRTGVLLLNQVKELSTRSTTLSSGTLADLQTDPNFGGDYSIILNDAADILKGYTYVNRGGYFPENQGIPRNQQITSLEAVYRIYTLPNGYELFLYRTPTVNTSQYFIRKQS